MGPIHTGPGLNGAVAAMVNGYLHVCAGYNGIILIVKNNNQHCIHAFIVKSVLLRFWVYHFQPFMVMNGYFIIMTLVQGYQC